MKTLPRRALQGLLALSGVGLTIAAMMAGLHLAGLDDIWIFDLAIQFSPAIAIAALGWLAAAGLAGWRGRRLAPGVAAGAAVSLACVLSFRAFDRPTGAGPDDRPAAVLTVITANVYGRPAAIDAVSELARQAKADIVAINEVPRAIGTQELSAAFPAFASVQLARRDHGGHPIRHPTALLMRDTARQSRIITDPAFGNRAAILAGLDVAGAELHILTGHAKAPLSAGAFRRRNGMLAGFARLLEGEDSFLLLGDFNTAPWSAHFRALPGQRACDAKFASTWRTRWPFLGLAIDHILAGPRLELLDCRVERPIGSDHFPVLARYRIRPAD
ncbi:MAG: hypothetical protein GVY06_11530 [Alphaproteobacteria bacterium]|jgi:endonuclease/exonuclease/phosphatase (EEP) superfamily protein YafD|nr:hypothetical protein [Alphaproteobacteria bacterium]